jgi:hypothetical protein
VLKAKSRITALAAATVHGSIVTISCVFIALRPTLATAATTLGTSRATLKTRSGGIDKAIDCNRACSTEENNTARRADRIPGMARKYAV